MVLDLMAEKDAQPLFLSLQEGQGPTFLVRPRILHLVQLQAPRRFSRRLAAIGRISPGFGTDRTLPWAVQRFI
ncbi:hypothetical protein [Geminicoccus sp.]|uniref:hypothetical protein n=1 Tax=Geminicoccus sp. TaxID=2024832 RepID=UPI002D7E8ADD|nr:hypothetical protein [Geminicoccus sp.]